MEEKKLTYYSRQNQDKIIYEYIKEIGSLNNIAVEFGARDGFEFSNVRMFADLNWKLYQWDKIFQNEFVNRENINAKNINQIFQKYNIPKYFDILSIDIDSNDYWVWKSLNYSPNIVCIEYNPNFEIQKKVTVKYDPDRTWQKDVAFGASFSAMISLGKLKGYAPIDYVFHDIIFMKKNIIDKHKIIPKKFTTKLPVKIHKQTGYEEFINIEP